MHMHTLQKVQARISLPLLPRHALAAGRLSDALKLFHFTRQLHYICCLDMQVLINIRLD